MNAIDYGVIAVYALIVVYIGWLSAQIFFSPHGDWGSESSGYRYLPRTFRRRR